MTKNFTPMLVVAAALRDGAGNVLMHRRPPHKHHGGLWEFPGGKVEAGESPRAALVREIEEEAALDLHPDTLEEAGFATGDAAGSDGAIVILLYTTGQWTGTPDAREGGEFGWFAPASLEGLDLAPLDVELVRQFRQKAG